MLLTLRFKKICKAVPHSPCCALLQDGYRVARPEFFSDIAPEAGSEEHRQLQADSEEVLALASSCLEKVR